MPERYFSIPLPNHAGLIELQEYLKTRLTGAVTWQDAATLHITLVYMPEVGQGVDESALAAVPGASGLPVFGLGGDSFQMFDAGEDGWAVTLRINRSPQLTFLQSAIFYHVRSLGIETSSYSFPGLYQPHVTLGYVSQRPESVYGVPNTVHLQVDRFVLSGEGYATVADVPLIQAMADGSPVMEMRTVYDRLIVSEIAGDSAPDVPYWSGMDIQSLTDGDDAPVFVTLPIAEDGAISDKRNYYSREFVDVVAEQARAKRVTANRGHLSDAERSTAFPLPAGYWVGTARKGSVLYGKAYVPPGENRDMVKRVRATGGKLATSIYGPGSATWDAERRLWVQSPKHFSLEHIDFAPADRAGVASLARVPHITSEMTGTGGKDVMGEQDNKTGAVDRTMVIREMTADDAVILPDVVRSAVLSGAPERKIIAEMREVVGVDENADVLATVRGIVKEYAELRQTVITQEIANQVNAQVLPDAVVNEGVTSIRGMVSELVAAKAPKAVGDVEGVVKEIMGRDTVKALLSAHVESAAGPKQRRPANKPEAGGDNPYLEPLPEESK
jgi:2'-5' RNA ligase